MRRTKFMAGTALIYGTCCACPVWAADPPATAPAQYDKPTARAGTPQAAPPYTPVRWNEDYSYLKDPSKRSDVWDPLKYIPFDDSGDYYASVGAQARYRYEYFNNNAFGAGPQDEDGYHLTRFLAHVDLHLSPYFRVFIQGKSAMEDGREGGPRPGLDADEADIQQFFADVRLPLADKQSLTFRFGRQDLIYGAQRLISPLDWTNARRTFEGAKVSYATPTNTLDAFWVRPVIVDKEELNEGDGDTSFAGVYDTLALPTVFGKAANSKIELYGLVLNKNANAATPVDSDTYTLGTRFFTNPKPWDFDVELDYQFGDVGSGGDISAWSFATEGGYTFVGLPYTPRTFLGFDIASGDSDPADPDRETFNQLFPLGHAYLGYIDVIGRQNIVDLHPGVELLLAENRQYVKKLTFRADYHAFWRHSDDDAVYNAGGAVLRADSGSDETFIGTEVDLLMTWQFDRHTQFYFGYSHFFAGDFIEETGAHQDIDFFYAAASYTF
jgi:hypothetical protein